MTAKLLACLNQTLSVPRLEPQPFKWASVPARLWSLGGSATRALEATGASKRVRLLGLVQVSVCCSVGVKLVTSSAKFLICVSCSLASNLWSEARTANMCVFFCWRQTCGLRCELPNMCDLFYWCQTCGSKCVLFCCLQTLTVHEEL